MINVFVVLLRKQFHTNFFTHFLGQLVTLFYCSTCIIARVQPPVSRLYLGHIKSKLLYEVCRQVLLEFSVMYVCVWFLYLCFFL